MKLQNEGKQIKEVIRRLNYYEKGLRAGKKIDHEECNLCAYAGSCRNCLIYSGRLCINGSHARASVSDAFFKEKFDSKVIQRWQAELKNRANKRLKDSGSKWRIAWERVQ